MTRLTLMALLTFLWLIPTDHALSQFDGSVPLLCAPVQAIDCDVAEPCLRGTPEDVNIPNFFKIDLKKKMISAIREGGRQTSINNLHRVNGKIILQGVQKGRGWTMVISEKTGKISATVSDNDVGFVIFGVCAPLP